MLSQSSAVTIIPDQTISDQFVRHTVTGISTPLPISPDMPGFIGASYLTIGDIDGNGIKDIICTSGVGVDANQNTADGAVAIFTWDGINLGNWTKSVINSTFPFPNETIIRDMDNDGDLDIMVMDNFIAGWSTRFVAGIYYLENQGGDITQPSNWIKRTIFQGAPDYPDGNWFSPIGKSSYHRAFFLDVDGDGKEDFITSKVCMEIWQNGPDSGWWWTDYPGYPDYPYPGPQYTWMEVFKREYDGYVQNDADGTGWGGTAYEYSRHAIGDGGGFLFNIADVDKDGDLDIIAPQFFIQESGSLIAKGPGDPRGDSLCWFENPGASAVALNPWTRRTIDNWYTSPNPTGRGFEAVGFDIDNDGEIEIVFSTHNHQDYKPDGYPAPGKEYHRFWPSGVFYFEIPSNPKATNQWTPISFDTGDPNLDPTNLAAVATDVYAVDRPGGPYSQGSPGTVRVDDINGDSYPELVVPGDGKGAVYYYESVGALNYKRSALYYDPKCMPGDAKIEDIDGDGDKDIIVVIYDTSYLKPPPSSNKLKSSSIFVFENKGYPSGYVPNAMESVTALDGTTWERVNVPGFGNDNNISVVAMAEFQGRLYALTRNQVQGCEVWRTNSSGGWEQVMFPNGVLNGVYNNNLINNVWARMIVFNNKLYFGFSAGLQGNYLGSSGCEIWRYDGIIWEPIISDKYPVAAAQTGTIKSISSCALNDGTTTAVFGDSTKNWTTNQWVGGVLTITSGTGQFRKFRIISNTANTITVQQNETAGTFNASGQETEFTDCASAVYENPFPQYSYTLGAVAVGDAYQIGIGYHQNGFGDFWNKTITAMRIFNNKLYVSTGLNYEYGGQVWFTENGDDWTVTTSVISVPAPYNSHSFGNYHSDTAYPDGRKPVSSSITDLVVSSVSGTPVLYAGGTGTSGNLGGCSRMARLTANGWELIVDRFVDLNDTGSNENGFGSPATCGTNKFNFMPWSLADFDSKLMVGVSGDGARVVYAPTSLVDIQNDGSWFYSIGSGNVASGYTDPLGTSPYPNGFDGYQYTAGAAGTKYQNLAVNLFPFAGNLYGGIICQYIPEYNTPPSLNELKGSQIWKTNDGVTWIQVTNNGFGDTNIINFEAFTEFGGILYVSGSKGASSTPSGLGGAKIFRLVMPAECGNGIIEEGEECESDNDCSSGYNCIDCQCQTPASTTTTTIEEPTVVNLVRFEASGKLARILLKWETASEIDNVGFNIYRAESADGEYTKINDALIPAKGSPSSGAVYRFSDWNVEKGKTYYYKLEDIDTAGKGTIHEPPAEATAWFLWGGKGLTGRR
jgi:hypothetical protein